MSRNHDVIRVPLITEKSMTMMGEHKYTFLVDPKANKILVRQAIEEIFEDVKVKEVNIMNVRKKFKRYGRYQGYTTAKRKAIITLTPDSKEIPVLNGNENNTDTKDSEK